MGLFSAKKKADKAVATETAADSKKRSNRKKNGMASIFKETVFEAVLDDFIVNTPFVVTRNGETCYIGLWLDTMTIGGFSKKSNRDEAKGSIIECINADHIKAVMTSELLESECMVLIPDEFTIAAMDEFELLTDASYTVAFVYADGRIENSEIPITYTDAKRIVLNAVTVQEFLHLDDTVDSADDETEEIMPDDETDVPSEDEPVYDDDFVSEDAASMQEEASVYEDAPSEDFDPYSYDSEEPDMPADEVPDTEDELEEMPADTIEPVADEEVWSTIQRRFYSDELGLEISTEPFDAQFLHGNTIPLFQENRGEGWMNDYLSQMSKDANVELTRLHQKNLMDARRKYCRLLSMYCDKITTDLSTDDTDSKFGAVLFNLKAQKTQALSDMDRVISERKDVLNAKWEKTLEQVGEDAKMAAQHQYRERYGRQHDADVMNIELAVKDEIDTQFNEAVHQLHDARRKEAAKMLDIGVNSVLGVISNVYLTALKKEEQRYNTIRASMDHFIDDNRKNDVAHAETVREQLRQTQEADMVRAELTANIENLSAEFEAKKLALHSDLENMQRQTNERLREKDLLCEQKINEIQARNTELQAQNDALMKQYAELDEKKAREYQSRITELSNECTSLRDNCKHVADSNKIANRVIVGISIVSVVAAIAVGFIIGTRYKLNEAKAEQKAAITDEFNKAKNQIDEEYDNLLKDKTEDTVTSAGETK